MLIITIMISTDTTAAMMINVWVEITGVSLSSVSVASDPEAKSMKVIFLANCSRVCFIYYIHICEHVINLLQCSVLDNRFSDVGSAECCPSVIVVGEATIIK